MDLNCFFNAWKPPAIREVFLAGCPYLPIYTIVDPPIPPTFISRKYKPANPIKIQLSSIALS